MITYFHHGGEPDWGTKEENDGGKGDDGRDAVSEQRRVEEQRRGAPYSANKVRANSAQSPYDVYPRNICA